MLVRAKFGIEEDFWVKLVVQGGKQMENELDPISKYVQKNAKVLVMASKKQLPISPEKDAPERKPQPKKAKISFEDISNHLAIAQQKYDTLVEERKAGSMSNAEFLETHQKTFLWFNSVIELMTKIDALKETSREEYDKDGQGRAMIKLCSQLLDKVDAMKSELKQQPD